MFSILIPTLNNFKYLKLSIESIKKTSSLNNELLVHVNEDQENVSRNYLKSMNISFTYSEKNIGLCSAINLIAKKATKDYLIYSHDDMYFCPDWDKFLMDEIKALNHKNFYLSGSMIEPYSGHIVYNCGETIETFNEKKLLDNIKNLNISDHQGSHFAPHCVHKDIWNKVGGFSEEFNPGIGSDPDFNMKLWSEGIRIFKGLSNFKVYHFGSITTRKKKSFKMNRGDKTFLKKWGISVKFFKKYYLMSKTKYEGPLKGPKISFKYFFELLLCKLKSKITF